MSSVGAVVDRAAAALCDAGFSREDARRDAVVLARGVLGWSQADWLGRSSSEATDDFRTQFNAWIARRREREPVAYILGEREFYGRPFRVTPDTLIPRPETEGLVESALEWLKGPGHRPARIVDIGTGTGCIAITLALECREAGIGAAMSATDTSTAALRVAQQNARDLGATDVEFLEGSLLAGVTPPLDLIVSNPPYVALRDRETLQTDVVGYEPAAALFGGDDGLEVIRALVSAARAALAPGGALMLEIGIGQSAQVRRLLEASGFTSIEVRADLQGIERVVIAG